MRNAVKLGVSLLIASSLLVCAQARGQTLVYSLSYSDTPASRRLWFANLPPPGQRSEQQDIETLRYTRKNEIYSILISDGKRSLLFSDEGMNLEIMPKGATVGADKVYTIGIDRGSHTTPTPGVSSDVPTIYELSLDGSRRFRRLGEIQKYQTPALLNPQRNKMVFGGFVANYKYVVSIYDAATWKLLRNWEFTQTHCRDCTPISYGWLAGGDRLFFNLDVEGDESTKDDVPGAYITAEDGADLGGIPVHAGELQSPEYDREGTTPFLIGQLPDGDYLFRDLGLKKGWRTTRVEPESFLVITGPDFKSKKQIPLHKAGVGYFCLSPSGKYLAYVEERQLPNYKAEFHVWSMDLESGAEKEMLVTPPPNPPSSTEPNVSLTILGWIDNN